MIVAKNIEDKEYEVYETEKFKFKIETSSLEKMREKKDFLSRLITKIQKNMRQTVKQVSGQEWGDNCAAFYNKIVDGDLE
jgi:hypothetical protein